MVCVGRVEQICGHIDYDVCCILQSKLLIPPWVFNICLILWTHLTLKLLRFSYFLLCIICFSCVFPSNARMLIRILENEDNGAMLLYDVTNCFSDEYTDFGNTFFWALIPFVYVV